MSSSAIIEWIFDALVLSDSSDSNFSAVQMALHHILLTVFVTDYSADSDLIYKIVHKEASTLTLQSALYIDNPVMYYSYRAVAQVVISQSS